mgnify:CR=1 FL=1
MVRKRRGNVLPRTAELLDVVIRQALTELGDVGRLVFRLVEIHGGHIHGGAGYQILLPGDLIGGVSLRLGAGTEAHAGDAVRP